MFFADPVAGLTEMARVARPGGTVAVATWASIDQSPGYLAMVQLLKDLFANEAASALMAPFSLGTSEKLDDLVGGILPSATIALHQGVARFDSLEAWVHTDVRGWTLADMIDDDQYEHLLASAKDELTRFIDASGTVRFPAPALIATASV